MSEREVIRDKIEARRARDTHPFCDVDNRRCGRNEGTAGPSIPPPMDCGPARKTHCPSLCTSGSRGVTTTDQAVPPARKSGAVGLTFLFTGFIAAAYGFGVYLFPAVMPDMLAALSLNYGHAGTIMAASQAGFLIAALIGGILTNRIGASRLILLSMACCTLCLLLVPLTEGFTALAVALFFTGAASASVWVPMVVVAKALIPEAHQGKALGLMSSGTAYGVFVNGSAIPVLLPAYGWQSVWFFVAALTGLLFVWGWYRLAGLEKTAGMRGAAGSAMERMDLRTLAQPAYLTVPAMMFLNGFSCMPAQNYLVAFVRDELGHGIDAAGDVWKVIGFIGMFGGFLMGILADKITVKKALVLAYLLLGVSFAAFADHRSLVVIYLGAALFGLAFNAIFGLIPAYVSLAYPTKATALIFGMGNVMLGLGAMTGNFLGGVVKDESGSFQQIYIVALVSAAALIVLAIFLRRPRAAS